jgi:ATP-dependent Clp protease ATP-binding subunit ClpA
MRDFRNAKAMAHVVRASLAAKGFKITVSQSLELIVEAFGVADWNTLAAAIHQCTRPTSKWPSALTRELERTLWRALAHANEREHEFATLEHLLFALTDDAHTSAALVASKVDLGALRQQLASYIKNDLKTLVTDEGHDASPTAAFRRAVYRATLRAKDSNRDATGLDVLVSMLNETDSPAVWLLSEHGIDQQSVANFASKSRERRPGPMRPMVVRRSRRRPRSPGS